jgi:Lon protease-like protein
MQETLLPLFPLEVVLLPSILLPLHIFEERYKEMIGEAIRDKTEFGVVQAGEKGILNLGCTATVEKLEKEYPDGRMDIISVGRRRFEILFLDEAKPYLRGAVNYFDDEDFTPASADARKMALAGFELLRRQEQSEREAPDYDDPQLSFKIAEHVPDLALRQTLLAMRSEAERIAHINRFFPEYLANLKRAVHVRKVAPTNGHGFIAFGKRPE